MTVRRTTLGSYLREQNDASWAGNPAVVQTLQINSGPPNAALDHWEGSKEFPRKQFGLQQAERLGPLFQT